MIAKEGGETIPKEEGGDVVVIAKEEGGTIFAKQYPRSPSVVLQQTVSDD